MKKTAIVFGAGRIGRGLVSQILSKNDYHIVHVDAFPSLVESMEKEKEYTIHVMGYPEKNTTVKNLEAYEISNYAKIAEVWNDADYVFTAVGGNNLESLAQHISEIYKLRTSTKTSNIIICENWLNPAAEVSGYLANNLGSDYEDFQKIIGISEAVVLTTGAADPSGNTEPTLDTWLQDFLYLPVNEKRLIKPYHTLEYLDYIEDFGDLLKQKIYTNNTSVASISYLGYVLGHTVIPHAANDPKIEPILDAIYDEINVGLIKGLGISEEKQLAFAKRAKEKYQDYNIADQVVRVGRDPIRKLRIDDRLVGPALLCLELGVEPTALAMATASALRFDADKEGLEVNAYYLEHGVAETLNKYSGLDADHPFVALVEKADREMEAWIHE